MRRFLTSMLLACLMAGGCSWSVTTDDLASVSDQAPEASGPTKGAQADEFIIGEPIGHKNLTVFPVTTKTARAEDRFLTLDEGLKAGTVEVFEVGAEIAGPRTAHRQQQRQDDLDLSGIVPPLPSERSRPTSGQRGHARPVVADDDPFASPPPGPPTRRAGKATTPPQVSPSAPASPAAAVDPPDTAQEASSVSPQLDGPDVNRLMIVNRSDKPLYLMPGEIIYGGQQDRTIAEEAIILADRKPVPIKVYCVEAGRWAYRDEAQTVAALAVLAGSSQERLDEKAAQKLAASAKEGKFVAPAGSLNKSGRIAVQDGKGQQAVWSRVDEANSSSGVASQSGAFTANYTSPEMEKQLRDYLQTLQKPVADQHHVVGAIVAVNGKIEAVDVFQSTPLFQKLWPKLLKSHALDAAMVSRKPEAEKLCTVNAAKEFFHTAMQANVEKKSDSQGGLVVTKRDSEKVMSFSAADGNTAAFGMGGGFGGAVHSAGFAK